MIRLAIAVEGETEEAFVKSILVNHLHARHVYPTPILLGGNVSVASLASEMTRLYWNFDQVTSLVDFYGFRGKGNKSLEQLELAVSEEVNRKIERAWDRSRIFPYIQRHEYEGLLFSDVNAFARAANATSACVEGLRKICSRFNTPEDIDDGSHSAPSKRILKLMPNYQKIVHGVDVATEIGLQVICCECPRFNNWLLKLESLGVEATPNQ